MIEINKQKVQIKIEETVYDIPIRNMTTSLAFQLSELQARRDAIKVGVNNEKEAFQLVEEMFSALVENYDANKHIIDQIPIDSLEDFIQECLEAIQGIKKKASTNTKAELTRSKIESNSKSMGSKKKR